MANKGDTVHLAMEVVGKEERDVTWKFDGKEFIDADICTCLFSVSCFHLAGIDA